MTLNLPHIHHSNKPELHIPHTAKLDKSLKIATFSFVFNALSQFGGKRHIVPRRQDAVGGPEHGEG